MCTGNLNGDGRGELRLPTVQDFLDGEEEVAESLAAYEKSLATVAASISEICPGWSGDVLPSSRTDAVTGDIEEELPCVPEDGSSLFELDGLVMVHNMWKRLGEWAVRDGRQYNEDFLCTSELDSGKNRRAQISHVRDDSKYRSQTNIYVK